MAYGTVKVDNITFDNGGSDQNVTVSGLYRATTSGVTLSGTIAATTVSGVTIIGSTTVSGATVTGTTANFTSGNFSDLNSAAATVSGNLVMTNQQQVRFREAAGNGVNYIALQAPALVASDKIITLPDVTGTVITTGDSGTVTSTMIADGTIVDADINASAAIALSKLATGALPTAITVASANIVDGTIVNADINASAAIVDTKLATISTAGKVSGTAITSGAIATSGQLTITNASPIVVLAESDGTATHSQTALVRNDDQFFIQTRSSTGVFVSSDYLIPADASGATDHVWRIANTEKARLNSSGLTVVDDLTISDKIIHAGDTNTAIRFPAADTIAFETNGSERARIDSFGNVGIGTSSPGAPLDVVGAVVGASFGINATALASSVGNGIFAPTGNELGFTTNLTERARINSSGNVGIGTSLPQQVLHVTQSGGNNFAGIRSHNSNTGTGIAGIEFSSDSTYAKSAIGLVRADTNGVGSLVFYNASSTGAANWSTADERLRITSAGNVGIGTASPESVLDARGTVTIKTAFKFVQFNDNTNDVARLTYAGTGQFVIDANGPSTQSTQFTQ